jgi:hypothetical protein
MGILSAHDLAPIASVASFADASKLFLSAAGAVPFAAIQPILQRWCSNSATNIPCLDAVSSSLEQFVHKVLDFRNSTPAFAEQLIDEPQLFPRSPLHLTSSEPKLQRRLSVLHHEMSFSGLISRLSQSARAWRLSLRVRGASAPLEAIPSCPELALSNEVFRFFLFNYQVMPAFELECTPPSLRVPCPCHSSRERVANAPLPTAYPFHFLCCAASEGMTVRHDEVGEQLAACVRSVDSLVYSKLQHESGSGSHSLRPDYEVTNFPSTGDHAFVEVTVINPIQSQRVRQAAQLPLSAAAYAESLKMNKFSQLAAAESRHLLIAAFEASGAFGRGVQHILRLCALRVNQAAFEESAAERTWASRQFRPYWDQRVACGFWRGSYQMFLKNSKALESQSMLAALSSAAVDELYEHSHAVQGGQASRGFHQPPPLLPHSVPSSAPRQGGEAPPRSS